MKITIACAALLCFATATLHAQDAPLFRMTSNNGYGADSNQPSMIFQETERSDTASIVEAVQSSGSIAAKSMFLLRGSCALMKERGKRAFRTERLSRDPIRFIVRFVPGDDLDPDDLNQPPREGSVISAAKCDLIESVLARARVGAPSR
jgi:hypothetical protein